MNDTIYSEPAASTMDPVSECDYQQSLDCICGGDYPKSLEILDTLAGPASRDARIRYARAVAYLSTGEFRKAGTDLVFTIAIDRSFLPAYRHLGFVFLSLGKEEAAVKVLKAAIDMEPRFAEAWCVLGDVYMELGEPENAKEALDTALGLEPDNPEPHCKLAMYYLSRGDMKGLRHEYEVLRDLDHDMAAQISELLL
jgi:Tfp pilus assembly protein PilF